MFILGGSIYCTLEILYRNHSDRLMVLCGGLIFLLGGMLNNYFSWKMDLLLQCFVISMLTTVIEVIVGNIDFYLLHLNIWDYSNMPFNYFNGKVCLPFTILWFFLGFVIVFVSDAIAYYWMHKGEQPRYYIFGKKIFTMQKRGGMGGMFTSFEALQAAIQTEFESAMSEGESKSYLDALNNAGDFYTKGNPVMYDRTGQYGNSPKTTGVNGGGNHLSAEIYLDQGFDYSTGTYSTPQIFSGIESGGNGVLGKPGRWAQTEEDTRRNFENAFSKRFK